MAARSLDELALWVAEAGGQSVPCPLLSRGRPVLGAGVRLEDRGLEASPTPAGEAPWVAVQVGVGPARVLLSWEPGSGAELPGAYRVETSARSMDGRSGSWRLELAERCDTREPRARVLDYDGQSLVRVSFEPAAAPVSIARLDVHDVSDGTDDVWLVLGDELARQAFEPDARDRQAAPGVPELIHREYPGYHPAVLVEAGHGESPRQTLERLETLLARHPHARRVALCWSSAAEEEGPALAAIAEIVQRARRVPVFARLPAASSAAARCNDALAALERALELMPGPDLGAFEPPGAGTTSSRAELQRLWARAIDPLFVPQ